VVVLVEGEHEEPLARGGWGVVRVGVAPALERRAVVEGLDGLAARATGDLLDVAGLAASLRNLLDDGGVHALPGKLAGKADAPGLKGVRVRGCVGEDFEAHADVASVEAREVEAGQEFPGVEPRGEFAFGRKGDLLSQSHGNARETSSRMMGFRGSTGRGEVAGAQRRGRGRRAW